MKILMAANYPIKAEIISTDPPRIKRVQQVDSRMGLPR